MDTGLGALENALAEEDGSLLLSVSDAGEVRRRSPDGEVSTVLQGLSNPGGLARDGAWAYVTTGLSIDSATQGLANGEIVRFGADSGRYTTWATGLVAPNGLVVLEDGSAIATRTLSGAGEPSEVTRVSGDDPSQLDPMWSDLTRTNGAVLDSAGDWVYVSRDAERAEIWRISVDDPTTQEKVADLGEGLTEILDDLTLASDDALYVAAWGTGKVYRVDPTTGDSCAIATDLPQVTAVEQHPTQPILYATSHTGTLYQLTPT